MEAPAPAIDSLRFSAFLVVLLPGFRRSVDLPVATIRQYPVPTISSDDPGIPDDEWVSELVRLQSTSAAQLVPILRPLLPQYGHLAAYPEQNALLVVDRYGNVKRIIALVRSLDKPAASAPTRQP